VWCTAAFVAIVLVVASIDGALHGRASPHAIAQWSSTATSIASKPWRTVTSIPLTSGPRMTVGMCIVIVALFGVTEYRLGWRAATIAGVAGSVIATLACDVALLGGAAVGIAGASATARAGDFGPSGVTAAAAGALARSLTWPGAIGLGLVTLNGLVVHHQLADWEHLVAFAVGAGATRE
jgi:hypothetical protein